ncbi:amidohydrolase [Halomonas sp. ML-15]|uniref:M20 aminoacylase family protein n=1 Tax=Halomonas sp. ML-15 TaxID=2773305 RepID=UPI001747A9F4|nr:M20 aminoacylase family protein [Halomonas sp. ML-15]MBD3894482.1 amidohydrolase [Halomonas sp. ML-15]
MPTISRIKEFQDELVEIRHDLHAHPELGFEESRTSALVAEKLREWGLDEVHTEIAGTGVVGIIKGRGDGACIGLRADMDALPIHEVTGLPYASQHAGKMHACGHDGHTTILLGAARYLAESRNFSGTVVLIFQPAEEGLGGARRMLADRLFERFPCDEVYGLHNDPTSEPEQVTITPGPAMAGATFFDITVHGDGAHAAMPHQSRDPIIIANELVQQLQAVVSRNAPPTSPLVLSVTQVHAGSAYNVIPDSATISGTVRYFEDELCEMVHERMRRICKGLELSHDVRIDIDLRNIFNVLVNDAECASAYIDAAADIVGKENARLVDRRVTGSEDFADMLQVIPGAYCWVGHAGSIPLHNPGYVLDDGILPVGASIMARMVERRLAG